MSDKPILFVRCDSFETFGLAPEAVRSAGADVRVWEALDPDADRPEIDDVGGIVLFGSSYNVEQADEQLFIKEVRELARKAVGSGTPFLGVCFGAQVLAWALDSEVVKAPVREVGFEPIHPTPAAASDPLLSHHRDGDLGFQWHMDTFELPEGAELLVTGDRVHNQAYRVGDRTWGVQYHFEVDGAEIRSWLETYARIGGDLESTWGKTNEQVLEESEWHLALHEARGRETFRRFVERVRALGR
ncbi:MAG TPA: type 1 glutamine amidotransferase [Actinomycetota bacterium]|nr:type 1 glutamine amidotransferase [Actinomycetota bacterium]